MSYDFENLVNKYDIICLSETKLCDRDKIEEIDGYTIVVQNRKNARRSSGGLAVLVKNHLCKFITIINTASDYTLWFKINKSLTGYDLLFCNVYIPPENSHYSSVNMFDVIEEEFVSIHQDEITCLLGDFNARTKNLTDLADIDVDQLESLNIPDYVKCKMAEEKILDDLGFSLQRVSQDPSVNNYGLRLVELCKNLGLYFLNGRVDTDEGIGKFTCDERSVVDYIISAPKLFPHIDHFSVQPFDGNYSDKHNALLLFLRVLNPVLLKTSEEVVDKSTKNTSHLSAKWSSDKSDDFKHNLDHTKVNEIQDTLTDLLAESDSNQADIDTVVSSIGSVFTECATEIGIMKNVNSKKSQKRKGNSKPWYNAECETKRRMYLNARNKYAYSKLENDRTEMKRLNKQYKLCLKQAYRKYHIELNDQLRHLHTSDSKKYWAILKETLPRTDKDTNIPIDEKTLFTHFKNLNDAEVNIEDETRVLDQGSVELNKDLNEPITVQEIKKGIDKLKNNKAYGIDLILNEYIKCTSDLLLPVYEKLFNLILNTGIIPSTWLTGIIKPLYKNKGEKNDVNNYRGITILSCFGKLFTAVLNNRLNKFLESVESIGEEQTGFRKGYTTLDHILTIRCILDLYLARRKRLYCCFVDYRKAFDSVDRILLWQKLLSSDINGRFFKVIFNLYKSAKSCVCSGDRSVMSDMFKCLIGVRQGENLSPILFAIFLNDLESFMANKYKGLPLLKIHMEELLSDDDVAVYLNLFVLLYADDTVVLSESPEELQKALDGMHEYCQLNQLSVNVSKTKVMIFSRGKVRNVPIFKFGDDIVEKTDSYKYLGITLNYNNSFIPNLKSLSVVANKAMFALLQKGKDKLDVDTMLHLFDSTVMPILLYGCEIWGDSKIEIIERMHLRFCKILLKLNKSTPNLMVYGELGRYPLEVYIKTRMVTYWHKLVTNANKLSSKMCKLMYSFHCKEDNVSDWLSYIKKILDEVGMSHIWITQGQYTSTEWLKCKVKQTLMDQFQQAWRSNIFDSSKCCNYRIFKSKFGLENYLVALSPKLRESFTKFRCRNHKLPIESGIYTGIVREERLCSLCTLHEPGDEFHYIFCCDYFAEHRRRFLMYYYRNHTSCFKMDKLFNTKGEELIKLCQFIKQILKEVK